MVSYWRGIRAILITSTGLRGAVAVLALSLATGCLQAREVDPQRPVTIDARPAATPDAATPDAVVEPDGPPRPECVEGSTVSSEQCSAGLACNAGKCLPCVAGESCTPEDRCHKGTRECGAAIRCVDTGALADPGTTCGDNLVCSAEGKCAACTVGEACTPTDLCKAGKIECKTGAPVCAPVADAPNGSACGEGQVCSAGACVACRDGMTCVPTNKCHTGSLSCSTGTPQCMDVGSNLANGTSCGEGQVCRDGDCTACLEKMPCSPPDAPCKAGEIRCASGSPVCVATATNAPDGKECGAEQACRGGMCRQCRTTGTCGNNPCKDSTYACQNGVESCRETNKANGTLCPGNDNACLNGSCQRCRTSGECDNNDCRSSSYRCEGGRESCQNTGNARDGTGCGNQQACRGGSCQQCRNSGECTPDGNNDERCLVGRRQCGSDGVERCVPNENRASRAPGFDCGGGRVCARKANEDRTLTCRTRLPDSATSSCQQGRERTRECASNYCNENSQCDQCGRDPFECCPDGSNNGCDGNHFCNEAQNCQPKLGSGEPCEQGSQCRSGTCAVPPAPNGVCSNDRSIKCTPGRSNGPCPMPDPLNPPNCVDAPDPNEPPSCR